MRKKFKRGIRGITKWGKSGKDLSSSIGARLHYFNRYKRKTKRAYRGKYRFG